MGLASATHDFHLTRQESACNARTSKIRDTVYQNVASLLDSVQLRFGAHQHHVSRDVRTLTIKCKISGVDEVTRIAAKVAADCCLIDRHFAVRFEAVDEIHSAADFRVEKVQRCLVGFKV